MSETILALLNYLKITGLATRRRLVPSSGDAAKDTKALSSITHVFKCFIMAGRGISVRYSD